MKDFKFVKTSTYILPLFLHLFERLLERELLAGRLTDALELGYERIELHVDELAQTLIIIGSQRVADDLRDLIPMSLPQALVE